MIREVTPEDAALLRLGFDHLSETSRHFRFFGAISTLSEEQVAAFTSESDRDHVAIGAAVPLPEGLDPAGTARYIRLAADPRTAEFALTVVDRYQRLGLGSLLLGVLAAIARQNGVDRLLGYVMRANRPMMELMEALGADRRQGPEPSVHEMLVELHDDPARYPPTAAGDAVRRAFALVRTRPPGP
ncbi:GNAT family N-acetyltransferase [Roseibacterium sp. SDUM158017]|uniref:GNAT family N-acetyltransferase n=1 Tax=Roseicyclus salinarum TaxID=3036773 RepID=UPI002414E367|nr:GNAT family N-acetyltransferase [Roseibacterium sp. SDUM158017]MDG4647233.1 GNAT family N-acetyltransferase [Roseibacterium sp. SDUM158017]